MFMLFSFLLFFLFLWINDVHILLIYCLSRKGVNENPSADFY